jgi:hypothetical protein
VRHGTSSSISLGASCPSDCANGPTGSDQWDLVLRVPFRRQSSTNLVYKRATVFKRGPSLDSLEQDYTSIHKATVIF